MSVVQSISVEVKTNAGSAAKQFRSLSSALAGVQNAAKNIGGNHSGSTAHSVKSVGSAAKSATGAMGKLFASIKRIAFYRLLRTFIKELSQAFRDGLKNAYAFSRGISGSLAQALDHLASSTGQMKNQMGAAFGELLQTIMPIIEAIVSAITRLMSALSALFAALGGRMQYLSAGDTAESWDKATGAAKKYKNTILGFDEINRLNDENGGGGGSGADQGVWELADLPDWAKKIKDAIDDGDWYAAGKALADHLNEIIEAWDAYGAGKLLGEKINNVIAFAFGFLKNFDFGNLGKKVAEFLNGIFDTVNWNMLGRTLVMAFTGIFDFLIGFIENIDTGSIAKAISDFFKGALSEAIHWLHEHEWGEFGETVSNKIHEFLTNIDWENIALLLSNFLIDTFTSAKDFLDGVDWDQIGTDTYNAIINFIRNIKWRKIAETFSGLLVSALNGATSIIKSVDFEALGGKIYEWFDEVISGIDFAGLANSFFYLFGAALAGAVKFIWGFIKQAGQDIADYFDRFIEFDGHESIVEVGAKIIGGILEGIAQALVDVYFWIMENVMHPIIKAFCDAFGIHSPSTVARDEVGVFIGDGLLDGISQPFNDIYNWLKTNIVDPLVDNVKSLLGIDNGESSIFKDIGQNVIDGLLSGLKNAWQAVTTWFEGAWNGIKSLIEREPINASISGSTPTGSIYVPSYHADGGSFSNDGTLFVAGEAGAEIVSNLGNGRTGVTNVEQMEAAVANGNANVVSAVYAMANMIVKAVNEIDPDIQLDGQSLADKMYHYNQQAGRRYGVAMVT